MGRRGASLETKLAGKSGESRWNAGGTGFPEAANCRDASLLPRKATARFPLDHLHAGNRKIARWLGLESSCNTTNPHELGRSNHLTCAGLFTPSTLCGVVVSWPQKDQISAEHRIGSGFPS